MIPRFVRYFGLLLVVCLALPGCAFFARKPPLPKQASIEHVERPAVTADFDALVENADIIYFPTERAGFGAKAEPAARLIEALQKRGRPFAVGWDLIGARQQPLLDSLSAQDAGARESVIAQLELTGSGRAREHCRAVLRELSDTRVSELALRYPGDVSTLGLARREFAAERIVRYLGRAGAEARALIFLREEDLSSEEGAPFYVAQKLQVRQLVFGSDSFKKGPPRLLTAR